MRKLKFATGEIYHIYNRGNNKRPIFLNQFDLIRFFKGMREFNAIDPIGSIYENSFIKSSKSQLGSEASKLVDFVCYCLNPNHFHFMLVQKLDRGIEKFMHKLGTGFTKYFNEKHKLSGSLFQGPFKAKHVDSNEYLLHLSAYINLNDRIHKLGSLASKSSLEEYIRPKAYRGFGFCNKSIVLDQFKNTLEYKEFAEESARTIKEQKVLAELLKEAE